MVVIGVCFLSIPAMPSLVHMLDLKRTGEAAGRCLCPCLPQVAIHTVFWLRFPHSPCGKCYMYFCIWSDSTYISQPLKDGTPVNPRRRR